ncbi:MAG TPA: cysteine peptidase family C39 domain-containing protein [Herbaspirillum sp.]|nr:cysteine peptidase family C39 domain-containing protein [Herbaspirillum sp.]
MKWPFRWQAGPRRVPMVAQQEAVECGAACLAMVLAYHGRWVTLEELREQCGITRDGTKATNVVKAARLHRMVAKGLQKDASELGKLPLPLIVFWNFNHFIVVESIGAEKLRIVDPAVGPMSMTHEQFAQGYTGIALAFEPAPDFEKNQDRPSLFATINHYLRGFRLGLAFALAAGIALIVPGVLGSGFNQLYVDNVLIAGRKTWLIPVVTGMVIAAVLKMTLSYLSQVSLARLNTSVATSLAAQQMWRLLELPLNFFAQRYSGDVANRFTLIDRLSGLVSNTLAPALIGIPNLIGYFILLLLLDPVLAGITGVAAILALAVLSISMRGLEDASRRMTHDDAKLYSMTIQGFSMIDEFKMSGTESAFTARWASAQARVITAEQGSTWRSNVLNELSNLIVALAGVAILIEGGLRVMEGALTIGMLLAFQTLMGSFVNPLLGFVGVGGQLQTVRGLVDRLDDIRRYGTTSAKAEPDLPAPDQAKHALLPANASNATAPFMELKQITFSYSPLTAPVLKNTAFNLPTGARIALVGSSGSGKSTLGRIIVGLTAPSTGAVTVMGRTLAQWKGLPGAPVVAYVEQSVVLFEGTVRNNLTLWDQTIAQDRLVEAARDACAHDFIMRMQGGYEAKLMEGGRNMSGGERQRLAIARALAVDPLLLVLDEATSALDPEADVMIMDAVRRRGCTCIIIAQRLSSIRDCDCILVMKQGEIVEAGNHEQLMAKGGEYSSLVST